MPTPPEPEPEVAAADAGGAGGDASARAAGSAAGRRLLALAALLPVGAVASAVALKWAPTPWAWVFGGWAGLLIAGAVLGRWTPWRVLCVNAAAVLLVVCGFELWLGHRSAAASVHEGGTITSTRFTARHELYGYAPVPGAQVTSKSWDDSQVYYDVTYTIGADGLRVSNPPRPAGAPPPEHLALFFGCSFTFGAGMEDRETLPWQFAEATGGRWETRNFGVQGYGPHQMLAMLDHDDPRLADLPRAPELVVYLAIYDHAERAAGLTSWDTHGPRYTVDAEGHAVFAGHFDDVGLRGLLPSRAVDQFTKCNIYGAMVEHRRQRGITDLSQYLAIVTTARDRVRARWPDARFLVLLWDDANQVRDPALAVQRDAEVSAALGAAGVEVQPVSAIIPTLHEDLSWYISRLDYHPRAQTHGVVARWLAAHPAPPAEGAPAED